jgi:uncharacterized membrane protein YfcA
MPDSGVILLVLAGAFAGGFVSGLSGFAFVMVALGFWAHRLEPAVVAPLLVACSAAAQVHSISALRKSLRFDLALPYILGAMAGIPVGVWLLAWIQPEPFKLVVGIFLLVYGALMLWIGPIKPMHWGGRASDVAVGWIGGVMAGIAGLSGAVPTIWMGLRGWSRDDQRGAFQPFILTVQLATLGAFAIGGFLTLEVGTLFLLALPAMAAGVALGVGLYRRIDDVQFRRVVLWLLLVSGVTLVL